MTCLRIIWGIKMTKSINEDLKSHVYALVRLCDDLKEDMFKPNISKIHELLTDEEAIAIGDRVKFYRKNHPFERALTQKELANKVGVDQAIISRLERGDKYAISYHINKISKALRLKVETLMLDEDEYSTINDELNSLRRNLSRLRSKIVYDINQSTNAQNEYEKKIRLINIDIINLIKEIDRDLKEK